jgi:hypothetical protein
MRQRYSTITAAVIGVIVVALAVAFALLQSV